MLLGALGSWLLLPLSLTCGFVGLSMEALLLQQEIRQISIVEAMVTKSMTRELQRTKIARRRIDVSSPEVRITRSAMTARPEAAMRERSVARLTERTRHKFLVRLFRHNKRRPVRAYSTIAATSTWTVIPLVVALL